MNKIIVKNQYPIPWIDGLLAQLKRATFFSKIDLNSSYHQVPIDKIDVTKISFKYKEGLFDWLCMPLVLNNYSTTFMKMMDDILWPFTNSFIVVYLDDILIFNKIWEEDLEHIQ